MKLIFSCLISTLAAPAFALNCADPSSGLQAIVEKQKDQIHFRFLAARGYEAIPQFDGPVSAGDLPMIKYQVENLKEVGSGFEISIPQSKCELGKASENIFACYFEGKIPGTPLNFSALTGYRVKQSHSAGDFEIQNFRLLIGKEDRMFFLLPFPLRNCSGGL